MKTKWTGGGKGRGRLGKRWGSWRTRAKFYIMDILRVNYLKRENSKINGSSFIFYSVINELELTSFHFLFGFFRSDERAVVLIFTGRNSFPLDLAFVKPEKYVTNLFGNNFLYIFL